MAVIAFFERMVGAFAGMTLAYWVCVLLHLPQTIGQVLTLGMAMALGWTCGRQGAPSIWAERREFCVLLGLSLSVAAGTALLYAFNPDDSTFFHRIAYLGLHGELFEPGYDTRLAFDRVAPISAAHLTTSWEYALVRVGHVAGSDVIGYQIGGTVISIVLYVFAVHYTITHFAPHAVASTKILATLSVLVFLFFDADQNRRIGAWLFLGGWTGKCFLAAALIALFPAFDRARSHDRPADWLFLACLVVFLMGLTGSALFILPIGMAALIVVDGATRGWVRGHLWAAALMGLPVLVGLVFVGKFGPLLDDSYWRAWQNMPFLEYARLTLSARSLVLYLVLVALLLWLRAPWLRVDALRRFALYQMVLACVLLNPVLLPVFQRFVPSDGFWRIFYLFQYPTIAAVIGVWLFEALRQSDVRRSMVPATLVAAGILAGGSVLSLQTQWGYPRHLKGMLAPKLSDAEYRSAAAAVLGCDRFRTPSVVLAPEPWEVTAQMLAPSLQSVAARHMRHNFSNTPQEGLALGEAERGRARDFVSAAGAGFEPDFRTVLGLGVDIVVMRPAVAATTPLPGFRQVHADNDYVVFCRV
ncbi:hypothetical protein [Pseudorhodoferax sp. Leaf274]|uniref:hypothetical protein n=1 Tax=Pseudorhodoferax sp. Leaf274 TaxID=1736318 RepID=UPI0007032C4F|nr:hypothetical protein [Pseudorhodoferax sp. Leaf274]KQP46173.1 hypothetical protein ASF44_24600 [Pseudorhodoferax sp. Leaf274]